MKKISISGRTFEVQEPYSEGQTINAAEAKTLNQTRAENIGNNFRKLVKDAGDDETKLQEVAGQLAEYDAKYTFSMGGGVPRAPVDPVEREAQKIAREAIKAQLASEGRKIKDINAEKLAAAIERVASQEDVLKLARKRVAEAKKNVAGVSLGELGLGGQNAEAPATVQ